MFLAHYGMDEHPFGVTPNPRYLYLSPTHREALASLIYGVETGRGFMALIAKPGMGKTTLLFRLLESLESSARTAFLFHTQCDSREFFHYLLSDMGIDSQGQDLACMHEQLNQVLLSEARAGRRFVLVIDEAQNLDDSVLETVRLLSDFETPRAKLMQIILAGQPQLAEKLARPGLAQLRQRISLLARLDPFSFEETQSYVDHRLKLAGYKGPALFTPEAMEMIAARGEGIPRNINNICFNALSLGCALQKKIIDSAIVREVLSDLDVNQFVEGVLPDPEPKQPEPAAHEFAVEVARPLSPAMGELTEKSPGVARRSRGSVGNSGRPALRVGALAVAIFVTACFLVLFLEKAKFGERVPMPQAVNAANSTPPVPHGGVSAVKTHEPSTIGSEATGGNAPARVIRDSQKVPRPSRSAREAAPRPSKVVPARAPVRVDQRSTAQSALGKPLQVRTVLPEVPVIRTELPPSLEAPVEVASASGAAEEAGTGTPRAGVTRVRVGSQAQAAKLVFQPRPEYPAMAKDARVQGTVRMEAVIAKDGTVDKLRVLSGHPLLVEAAEAAVARWRYQPTPLNGNPVEVVTEVDVDFAF